MPTCAEIGVMREKSSGPILEARNLSIRFGRDPLFDPVSFTVSAGGALGIRGPTGSGKTTLARCLLGLQPETAIVAGDIEWEGRSLRQLNAGEWRELRGLRFAMLSQEPALALNPYLTISRQLSEYWRAHSTDRATLDTARDTIERLAPATLQKYPHQLSGGERQRAALALAVVYRPQILIVDEPTTAVDSITERLVLDFLLDLRLRSEMALIAISHQPAVLRHLRCTQIDLRAPVH
jgi:ABC-type glutathione transport system ATPase component